MDQPQIGEFGVDSWDTPIVLGQRICWRWEGRNVTIPLVSVQPLYPNDPNLDRGWHADLPTENGATVDLTYDEDYQPDLAAKGEDAPCHIWLYVKHPEYGHLIDARVRDGAIEYDPRCDGPNCTNDRCWCRRANQWWEYVIDGPQQVLERLAWLGRLPLKVAS